MRNTTRFSPPRAESRRGWKRDKGPLTRAAAGGGGIVVVRRNTVERRIYKLDLEAFTGGRRPTAVHTLRRCRWEFWTRIGSERRPQALTELPPCPEAPSPSPPTAADGHALYDILSAWETPKMDRPARPVRSASSRDSIWRRRLGGAFLIGLENALRDTFPSARRDRDVALRSFDRWRLYRSMQQPRIAVRTVKCRLQQLRDCDLATVRLASFCRRKLAGSYGRHHHHHHHRTVMGCLLLSEHKRLK